MVQILAYFFKQIHYQTKREQCLSKAVEQDVFAQSGDLSPFRKGLTVLALYHLMPLALVFNISHSSVLALTWLAQTITITLQLFRERKSFCEVLQATLPGLR